MTNHNAQTMRTGIVGLFFLLLFSGIILRFYIITVSEQHQFHDLAQKQYLVQTKITPIRGTIYDRSFRPLTINKKVYSAYISPKNIQQKESIIPFLEQYCPHAIAKLTDNPDISFLWIKRHLSDDLEKIIRNTALPDIQLIQETARYYPVDALLPIVGRTNVDNVGIAGIEYQCNEQLQGASEIVTLGKDARGSSRYFTHQTQQRGRPGHDLYLSVDKTIQFLVHEELSNTIKRFNAASGAAVVLDPSNGNILAMASYPHQEANMPITDVTKLQNNAISQCYEFGSVIKIFSALAALAEEAVDPEELIDCEGDSYYFDNFKVTNWRTIHTVPFHEVVRYSSNIGMAKITARIGHKLYDHYCKLGFTHKTGIELPGEAGGLLAPPERWSKSTPYVLSFGYEIAISLLQLARALSVVANDGYAVHPTLLACKQGPKPTRLYEQKHIDQLKDILEKSAIRHPVSGYRTMGKTGTARLAQPGGYSSTKHLYTFGGIIEKGDYRRVIAVFVKEPSNPNLWASQVSGPLFQKIGNKVALYERSQATT